jgi:hypothetical protein
MVAGMIDAGHDDVVDKIMHESCRTRHSDDARADPCATQQGTSIRRETLRHGELSGRAEGAFDRPKKT